MACDDYVRRSFGNATLPASTAEIVGIASGEIEALFRPVLSENNEAKP